MAYHVYLGKMLCPIAPSTLQLKIGNQNKSMTLINEGEVTILKQAGLTDINFNLLLPNVNYPFATYKSGFVGASYFLSELEKLKTDKKPFQFIVTRSFPNGKMLFDTNMTVSLETYDIKEDADQGFDVIVSVKLKQYRAYGTKTCKVTVSDAQPKVSIQTTRETTNSPKLLLPRMHKIQENENLWTIAKKYYGDGAKYKVIYEANKTNKKAVKNENVIFAGESLVIPNVK